MQRHHDQQPAPLAISQIPAGKITHTIYSLLRDERFNDVTGLLNQELVTTPSSRPALSLMAYCYYQQQDWLGAAGCYEELIKYYPQVEEYKLFYAQALYKAGQFPAALDALASISNPAFADGVKRLQAAIKYESDDLTGCRALITQSAAPDDLDAIYNHACILYKEGKYAEAQAKFNDAAKRQGGFHPEVQYNMALCAYHRKEYVASLKYVADIIEHGIREYPDLNVGVLPEDILSVGNSVSLHKSFLVEAFNLKAAVEYNLKNYVAAKEALQDMPPRLEEELDPVTLHNQALVHMDVEPSTGFEKLIFLLQQVPCPPETFGNLLLLYLKFEYYDAAADLLAENAVLARAVLSRYLYDFLDAVLMKTSSPEDSFKRLDALGQHHIEHLRRLSKSVQDARANRDDDLMKRLVHEYDDHLERYIPVLMAQAKIYWDAREYHVVEKIFRKSVEFCAEHDTWKLNVAHPIVRKHLDGPGLLDVTAIVLANLCVAYIMTSQNEAAEDLMRRIEKEEERLAFEDPNKRCFHLCIVNLVIGTLYCAKGNFEFGIGRVMKSMEPMSRKLGTDTWYYAKRCFVALFETLAKQMILLKDDVYQEILTFLDTAEQHGKDILAVVDPMGMANIDPAHNSVAYEARLLKALYLKLYL
ncbi:tetratricopeptide repeat protein 30B [Catenaria anguillulae PL171]|uniref:Tetratricopeptide repeat protein 30B n=1 Tax=Catenaria anguillulae PL171 TaxID=765915 RepID=A0A1Y2HRN3_9FUNG|nr:tetratricopeptide repeat protein 30B [Catenaria anguillulae PL171]